MKFKKTIAPIIVTVVMLLYIVGLFVLSLSLFHCPEWVVWFLIGIPPLAFIGVLIFVLRERIQEIRSGEEDDLSKY